MPTRPSRLSAPRTAPTQGIRKRTADYSKLYNSTLWAKLRTAQLAREPICQECQQQAAIIADHIVPHQGDTKLFYDAGNLQSLCKRCHDRKTAREDGSMGRARMARPDVTLVCGPAGSGKTTYVLNHMTPGDVIVDVDALHAALTGQNGHYHHEHLTGFILSVRDAIYGLLLRASKADVPAVWIIAGLPDRMERERVAARFNAKVVVFNLPLDACLDRIAHDPNRIRSNLNWRSIVQSWWNRFEPSEKDLLIY